MLSAVDCLWLEKCCCFFVGKKVVFQKFDENAVFRGRKFNLDPGTQDPMGHLVPNLVPLLERNTMRKGSFKQDSNQEAFIV